MKTFLLVSSLFLSLTAVAKVPQEIARLMDQDGTFVSSINGRNIDGENGTSCKITMSPYGGESSIIIDSVAYFTPTAHLDDAKKTIKNDSVIFTLTDTGRRPGGSACGDYTPMLSYKKTVEVKGRSLIIRQKFRCLLEGATEIVQGCKL